MGHPKLFPKKDKSLFSLSCMKEQRKICDFSLLFHTTQGKTGFIQTRMLCPLFPDVKAEMGDITIFDHVIFAFQALETFLGSGSKRATGHEIVEVGYFG